jgi:hypothetical protein
MFHIHTCVENTSAIFTFLYPLHLLSSSHYFPSLNMIYFTFLSFIVLVSVPLPCYFICKYITLQSVNPSLLFFLTLSSSPTCSTIFSEFVVFCTNVTQFQYYVLSFSSFPPLLVCFNSPKIRNMFCIYM